MNNDQQFGFRWITLRLYNIPIIDRQIDKAAEIHQ